LTQDQGSEYGQPFGGPHQDTRDHGPAIARVDRSSGIPLVGGLSQADISATRQAADHSADPAQRTAAKNALCSRGLPR
jgi:hypothetical protein